MRRGGAKYGEWWLSSGSNERSVLMLIQIEIIMQLSLL